MNNQRPYRGILIGGKDFVYGWHAEDLNGKAYIIIGKLDDDGVVWHYSEVIPSSVGQATGFKDKTCKEIYEGDIIEFYTALVPKGTNPVKRQTVKWNKRTAGFVDCHSGGEVIGNIHTDKEQG